MKMLRIFFASLFVLSFHACSSSEEEDEYYSVDLPFEKCVELGENEYLFSSPEESELNNMEIRLDYISCLNKEDEEKLSIKASDLKEVDDTYVYNLNTTRITIIKKNASSFLVKFDQKEATPIYPRIILQFVTSIKNWTYFCNFVYRDGKWIY